MELVGYDDVEARSHEYLDLLVVHNREVVKSCAEVRIFSGALSVMMRITYYGISFICEDADYYWTDSSSIMKGSLNSD